MTILSTLSRNTCRNPLIARQFIPPIIKSTANLSSRHFSTSKPLPEQKQAPAPSPASASASASVTQPKAVSSNYTAPPAPKPRGGQSPLRIWPFVAIFAGGALLFANIVKTRQGESTYVRNASSKPF